MSNFEKELRDVGYLIIKEAQDLIQLNGAYRSGRLYNGFDLTYRETEDGYVLSIENDVPYAGYIARGTYEWRGQDQSQNPVIRKYAALPPSGYPNVRGSYPYNRKGIEPINFLDPLIERIEGLNQLLTGVFVKKLATDILEEYRDILLDK